MSSIAVPPIPTATANDRLKQRFAGVWWNSITAAVVLHFVVFGFFPRMSAADVTVSADETVVFVVPDEIPIPPAPERLVRPAAPIFSDIANPEDVPPKFSDIWEAPVVQPPAPRVGEDPSRAPVWIPRTVDPRLMNADEVRRALERLYPPTLRDAGIGGTLTVWFYVDEEGRAVRTQLHEPSDYAALDRAALQVADVMRFAPAWNRDRKVAVWVAVPIRFTARTP